MFRLVRPGGKSFDFSSSNRQIGRLLCHVSVWSSVRRISSDTSVENLAHKMMDRRREVIMAGSLKGLERETLRVNKVGGGSLALTPHPIEFGSALTHPSITTDFSEAMPEFVTPAFKSLDVTTKFLEDIHTFATQILTKQEEMLWPCSMPPRVDKHTIPIANFGTSNSAQMKNIYRRALRLRYGARMQIISGIHFNYSLPENFWPGFTDLIKCTEGVDVCRNDYYFGLIRNFQRHSWLVPYLFGASPAVDKSFVFDQLEHSQQLLNAHRLEYYDTQSLYRPYATSLRMSDIGYKNDNQNSLRVSYNNLPEYMTTLADALNVSSQEYEKYGLFQNGVQHQLNTNVIQIENEFYGYMRPKRVALPGERPCKALARGGVQYVELRALDVNPFDPTGVNKHSLRFLESFMMWCLLKESPPVSQLEHTEIGANQKSVATHGRDPYLRLQRNGEKVLLRTWATEILEEMTSVCELMDKHNSDDLDDLRSSAYVSSLNLQKECVRDPDNTPSAHVLREMREKGDSAMDFGMRWADRHRANFRREIVPHHQFLKWEQKARDSRAEQREVEQSDTISLQEYLDSYFEEQCFGLPSGGNFNCLDDL